MDEIAQESVAPQRSPAAQAARRARRRPRVTEAITSELRTEIAAGRLPAGSRLPSERQLAADFGVSQPTVREALSVLDAMGIVEVRHGSGTFVSGSIESFLSVTLQTVLQMGQVGILEALEVRDLLGARSARLAADQATPEDIEAVLLELTRCDDATTVDDMASAIVLFQCRLSAAAHNPLLLALETFLIKLIMKVQLLAEADRGIDFWKKQTALFSRQRHELYRLLVARGADGLENAMRLYLSDQRKWFEADSQVTGIKLSDPGLLRALDETFLDVAVGPLT